MYLVLALLFSIFYQSSAASELHSSLLEFGRNNDLSREQIEKISRYYPRLTPRESAQLSETLRNNRTTEERLFDLPVRSGKVHRLHPNFVDVLNDAYAETVNSSDIYQITRLRICLTRKDLRHSTGCENYESDYRRVYANIESRLRDLLGAHEWQSIPAEHRREIIDQMSGDMRFMSDQFDRELRRTVFNEPRPDPELSWESYLVYLNQMANGNDITIPGKDRSLGEIVLGIREDGVYGDYYISPQHGLRAHRVIEAIANEQAEQRVRAIEAAFENFPESFAKSISEGFREYVAHNESEEIYAQLLESYSALRRRHSEEIAEAQRFFRPEANIREINERYDEMYSTLGTQIRNHDTPPRHSNADYDHIDRGFTAMNLAFATSGHLINEDDVRRRFRSMREDFNSLPEESVHSSSAIQNLLVNALNSENRGIRDEAIIAVIENNLIDPANKAIVLMAFLNSFDEEKLSQELDQVCATRGKNTPSFKAAFDELTRIVSELPPTQNTTKNNYISGLGQFIEKYIVFYSRELGKSKSTCNANPDTQTCSAAGDLIYSLAESHGNSIRSFENPTRHSIKQRAELLCQPNIIEGINREADEAIADHMRGNQSLESYDYIKRAEQINRMADQMNVGAKFPARCPQRTKENVERGIGRACDILDPGSNPLNLNLKPSPPLSCSKLPSTQDVLNFGIPLSQRYENCNQGGTESNTRVSELAVDVQDILKNAASANENDSKKLRSTYLQLARKKMVDSLLATIDNISAFVSPERVALAVDKMSNLNGCGVKSDGEESNGLENPELTQKLKDMLKNHNEQDARSNSSDYLRSFMNNQENLRELNNYVSAKASVLSDDAKRLMQNYNYCLGQDRRDENYHQWRERRQSNVNRFLRPFAYIGPLRRTDDSQRSSWQRFDDSFNHAVDDIYYSLNLEEWGHTLGINISPTQCLSYTTPGNLEHNRVVALQRQMQKVHQFESGPARFLVDDGLFVDRSSQRSGQRWNLSYLTQLTYAMNESRGNTNIGRSDHHYGNRPFIVPSNDFDALIGNSNDYKNIEKRLATYSSSAHGSFDDLVDGWSSANGSEYPGIKDKFNRAFDSALNELDRYDCQAMEDSILDGAFPTGEDLKRIVWDGDDQSTSFMDVQARQSGPDRRRVEANLLLYNNPSLRNSLLEDHPELQLSFCHLDQKINRGLAEFDDERIKRKWWERAKTASKVGAIIGASIIHPAAGLVTGLAIDVVDIVEIQLGKKELQNRLALERSAFYGHLSGDVSAVTLEDILATQDQLSSLSNSMNYVLLGAVTGGGFDVLATLRHARRLNTLKQQAGRRIPARAEAPSPPITSSSELPTVEMASRYRGENLPARAAEGKQVTYLSHEQRNMYEVRIGDDGLLYRSNGKLSNAPEGSLFVVSPDGTLYVNPFPDRNFHHSSFLSGGPVAFAGEIRVTRGVPELITNGSGHYRPSMDMLDGVLERLKSRGLHTSRLKTRAHDFDEITPRLQMTPATATETGALERRVSRPTFRDGAPSQRAGTCDSVARTFNGDFTSRLDGVEARYFERAPGGTRNRVTKPQEAQITQIRQGDQWITTHEQHRLALPLNQGQPVRSGQQVQTHVFTVTRDSSGAPRIYDPTLSDNISAVTGGRSNVPLIDGSPQVYFTPAEHRQITEQLWETVARERGLTVPTNVYSSELESSIRMFHEDASRAREAIERLSL
jgi:hypothetical protein